MLLLSVIRYKEKFEKSQPELSSGQDLLLNLKLT